MWYLYDIIERYTINYGVIKVFNKIILKNKIKKKLDFLWNYFLKKSEKVCFLFF